MNRNEAMAFLKEAFDKCTLLNEQFLWLMPPNSASLLSIGYLIQMKNPLHSDDLACMNEILRRHSLLLKIEKEVTIIYRP